MTYFKVLALKVRSRLHLRRETALVRASGLFDEGFYLSREPEARALPIDPVYHYLTRGAVNTAWPNPLFDPAYYYAQNTDVAATGVNPLLHYIEHGADEGRSPHPLFDPAWYLEQNPDVAGEGGDPLAHYLVHGAREGRSPHPLVDPEYLSAQLSAPGPRPFLDYLAGAEATTVRPNPLFDPAYYLEQTSAPLPPGTTPLAHYVTDGGARGLDPHPLFKSGWYLEKHPEARGENPLLHYLRHGGDKGRSPHPLFDPAHYLAGGPTPKPSEGQPLLVHYLKHPEAWSVDPHILFSAALYRARAGVENENPLFHYETQGAAQGLSPHHLFDPSVYAPPEGTVPLTPLAHYAAAGAEAARSPHPLFDVEYYLAELPKSEALRETPLGHYLSHPGAGDPHPLFDTAFYLKRYPDVAAWGGPPLLHYVARGAAEARLFHPLFDLRRYLATSPEPEAARPNALLHFVQCTPDKEGEANRLFDANFYRGRYASLMGRAEKPFIHYARSGLALGLNPHPLFDTAFYAARHPESTRPGSHPLAHFLAAGDCPDPNPLFDAARYLKMYPEAEEESHPLFHYLAKGAAKKHSPHTLFDVAYYVQHAGIDAAKANPLIHYFTEGGEAGVSPHLLFDPAHYLESLGEAAQSARTAPLAHYAARGWEAAGAHPLFDEEFYRGQAEPADGAETPLAHYMERGAALNLSPHPLLDAPFYRRVHLVGAPEGVNPLVHFIVHGAGEKRSPHPLFDTGWFVSRLDPSQVGDENPLTLYLRLGARATAEPHPLFATAYYLEQAGEILQPPLVHYLRTGAAMNYSPHPLFDPAHYLSQVADLDPAQENPLVHFLLTGAAELLDPNPFFDTSFYLARYPEVSEMHINPLVHYLENGAPEGRDPHPCFHTSYYLDSNPEAAEAAGKGVNPLIHFLLVGRSMGLKHLRKEHYSFWIGYCREVDDEERARVAKIINGFEKPPIFSVLVPVYETPEPFLRDCLDSVLGQLYPHFECIVVDDASPSAHVGEILAEYAARDNRIRLRTRQENGHIAVATNDALSLARGDYVVLLDHDDALHPHALFKAAEYLAERPETDMLYSDEDKIDEQGRHRFPFFKPDWSPDYFLATMYTCHMGVYRTSLVKELGGMRPAYTGSQDWDLVLRIMDRTNHIGHLPVVLYHWRESELSTALVSAAKPYAHEAAVAALADWLERNQFEGEVSKYRLSGHYRVRMAIRGRPKVSVVIPTANGQGEIDGRKVRMIDQCLEGLHATTAWDDFEVVVVHNESLDQEQRDRFSRLGARLVGMKYAPEDFNFSAKINLGCRQATGDHLLLLNDDVIPLGPEWMEAMVEYSQRPGVGAVGAKLLFPSGLIQHIGVHLLGGLPGHHYYACPDDETTYGLCSKVPHNYLAVTAACLMTPRRAFEAVGGLDESFPHKYQDVDFCLRLIEAGHRVVFTPFAVLTHHESVTIGSHVRDRDKERFLARWGEKYAQDPYYNVNLPTTALYGMRPGGRTAEVFDAPLLTEKNPGGEA